MARAFAPHEMVQLAKAFTIVNIIINIIGPPIATDRPR
jgi:hypothetical protein